MSSNEKRLLIILGIGGFILINILGLMKIKQFRAQMVTDRAKAQSEYNTAEMAMDMRNQVAGEMDWLVQHEPKPQEEQDVQSALQQLVEREATGHSLTVKSQKLVPTDSTQKHYHRAKVEFKVSGTEENLYKWIGRLQMPSEFRAVTKIKLLPETQDDTKIEASLTVEQWFVPPTSTL